MGVSSAINYPDFWTTSSVWILWVANFALPVAGAIIGAILGRRMIKP